MFSLLVSSKRVSYTVHLSKSPPKRLDPDSPAVLSEKLISTDFEKHSLILLNQVLHSEG